MHRIVASLYGSRRLQAFCLCVSKPPAFFLSWMTLHLRDNNAEKKQIPSQVCVEQDATPHLTQMKHQCFGFISSAITAPTQSAGNGILRKGWPTAREKGAEPTHVIPIRKNVTIAEWTKSNNGPMLNLLVNSYAIGCPNHDSPLMARGPGKQIPGHGDLHLAIVRT